MPSPAPSRHESILAIRHTVLAFEQPHGRDGPSAHLRLLREEVPVGDRGDLGHVRHAEDLSAPGQGPELPADDLRRPPADSGIDLVEHERAAAVAPPRGDGLDREVESRQLAARRDLLHRLFRLTRVGREEKRRCFEPRGSRRLLRRRLERHAKTRLLHGERLELLLDGRREPGGRRPAPRGESLRRLPVPGTGLLILLLTAFEGILDVRELVALLLELPGEGQDVGQRSAVLALQARELLQPRFDRG
jgi:hypothetical protein